MRAWRSKVARPRGETSNSFEASCLFETLTVWGQELKARHTFVP